MIIIVGVIIFYFVFVSAVGYNLMQDDKFRARTKQQRISETSLMAVALAGGAFGAKIAQKKFRHKTRKEPFRTSLNAMVIWNIIVIGLFSYLLSSHTVFIEEALGAFFEGGDAGRPVNIKVNRGLD